MKTFIKITVLSAAWLYSSLIVGWLILHSLYGDQLWWLAIINAVTPFLFLPLIAFILLGLVLRWRMAFTALIMPMGIFLWLYGALFLPSLPSSSTAQPSFTVMTFNIHAVKNSVETAQVILDNGAPDIVALQELRRPMVDVLVRELGDIYPYQSFENGLAGNNIGLLSRYPVSQLSITHLPRTNWEVQIVEVMIQGQTITIYNVHPHSSNIFTYLRRRYEPERWIEYSFQIRQSRIQALLDDSAKRSGPVIILGDFNSTEQSDAYAMMTTQFIDAYRAAGWGFGHTFPAEARRYRRFPLVSRQIRIDMIFHSDHFVAVESWVSKTFGESDHLPVIAKLAWTPPN